MNTPSARLSSLDALRGLDMLIILGLDALVYALYPIYGGSGFWSTLREQMGHAEWEGMRLYDCVFPLFVYIAGMSMCFSQLRSLGTPAWKVLLKLWWRAIILVLLGFLVNGAITWDTDNMRFASVLGLIGISGAMAGSLALLWKGRLIPCLVVAALILIGVGTAQYLGGDFTPGGSFNAKVDALMCPGVLYSRSFDPEGPFCILSATALCLLGYCSGRVFLNVPGSWKRALYLTLAALPLLIGGWFLPCIKGIWTPGFVLFSAGVGAILISLFHLLIDLPGLHKLSLPLRVIGLNALAAYVLTHLISFPALTHRLLGGTWALFLNTEWQQVANAASALLLAWFLCWFLYQKRVFIKL